MSFKWYRTPFFDIGRVGHIKGGQPCALVLFDIEECSAIVCSMQQHRFAGHLCEFGKLFWTLDDDFGRAVPRCFYSAGECEGCCSRYTDLSDSDYLFLVHGNSPLNGAMLAICLLF